MARVIRKEGKVLWDCEEESKWDGSLMPQSGMLARVFLVYVTLCKEW